MEVKPCNDCASVCVLVCGIVFPCCHVCPSVAFITELHSTHEALGICRELWGQQRGHAMSWIP